MKKVYVKTFGCQMNVYDSERMVDLLQQDDNDYVVVDEPDDADVIIFNTCSIREKANERIFSVLGTLNKFKQAKIKKGEYTVVIIAGCVAKVEGKKIFSRMPMVDIVVSGESYHNLPKMIKQAFNQYYNEKKNRIIDVEFKTEEKFASLPHTRNIKGISEFVAIQSGCDKFCTYCIVPYTRGREYSRPEKDVLDEIKVLADKGIKEITLLGQNVDNYHGLNENGKEIDLAELIYKVSDIDGIERIRYTTSYPSQFSDDLMEAHRDLPKLMPYVHLPVQSGSNSTLKRMNRRYTREKYLEIVEKLRKNVPDIALSSDFIVGFAGETDEDFMETVSLVEQVKYASSFSFKYSPRPGTVGITLPNQIPDDIQQKRLEILQSILDQQQIDFNLSCKGKIMPILVENTLENNTIFGRTVYLQAVIVDCKDMQDLQSLVGKIINVKITDANLRTLTGVIEK